MATASDIITISEERVIVILDGDQQLKLYPKMIHGVEVFTTTEEQNKEIKKRYASLFSGFREPSAA